MATDLYSLQERLDARLGIGAVTPEVIQSMLRNAVPEYNALVSNGFALTGTALDRDATDDELEALVLSAELLWLNGEANRWSIGAIRVSDVSGRVDPVAVQQALSQRKHELTNPMDGRLTLALKRVNDRAVMGEITANELGETIEIPLASTTLTGEVIILGTPVI